MKRCIALAGMFLLFSGFTMTWENPTMFEDNTVIPPGTLSQGYARAYEGDTNIGPWARISDAAGAPTWPYPATVFTFSATQPPIDKKWYTMTYVVPCDPSLPMSEPDVNKCESAYATAIQYVAVKKPKPPRGHKINR